MRKEEGGRYSASLLYQEYQIACQFINLYLLSAFSCCIYYREKQVRKIVYLKGMSSKTIWHDKNMQKRYCRYWPMGGFRMCL